MPTLKFVADSTQSTGLKWAAASSGALTKITSQSFSNSTAINVDSVFSSTYRNYKIIINITSMSANSSGVNFKLRSGGSTDSNADYYWQRIYGYITTATSNRNTGDTAWALGYFDPGYSNTIKMPYTAIIDISAPYLSGAYTQAYAICNSTYGNTPETGTYLSGLWKTVTTQFDGFAIQAQGADGFYGVVKVYGYQD